MPRGFSSFFELIFALELSLLPNSSQVDSAEFETQYDFDDWIMLVAGIYYATLEIDDAMQWVAAPILSLGAGAHRWMVISSMASFARAVPMSISRRPRGSLACFD